MHPSIMKTPDAPLSITDHDRDVSGMTYVYPVVSRRSGGVSIGINLNVNNACNWRCIYCQVPDLKRGGPPPVDLDRLRDELDAMLRALCEGDFMARHVPEDMRHLRDIALSGNGEPTSAGEFPAVIDVVGAAMGRFGLAGSVRPILISNGSLVHKTYVRDGLRKLAALGGEVWFKLDRATETGIRTVNDTAMSPERVVRNLSTACALCPTWIQTCAFSLDGAPP
jgi:wyosine [tRNA(Phe)-imidazoG37] synthetase (radical SAM superfamily)